MTTTNSPRRSTSNNTWAPPLRSQENLVQLVNGGFAGDVQRNANPKRARESRLRSFQRGNFPHRELRIRALFNAHAAPDQHRYFELELCRRDVCKPRERPAGRRLRSCLPACLVRSKSPFLDFSTRRLVSMPPVKISSLPVLWRKAAISSTVRAPEIEQFILVFFQRVAGDEEAKNFFFRGQAGVPRPNQEVRAVYPAVRRRVSC